MKMPCEVVIWHILPAIRRELVLEMVREGEINQSAAARLLGLTPAAVSQYIGGKRGGEKIEDEDVKRALEEAAKRIVMGGDVADEVCSICVMMREKGIPRHLFEEGGRTKCPSDTPACDSRDR